MAGRRSTPAPSISARDDRAAIRSEASANSSTGPDLSQEARLRASGYLRPAGLDEVGRGALAGPVVAAAVILPCDEDTRSALQGLRDSKRLRPAARCALLPRIRRLALAAAVGFADAVEIDCLGIARANELAMLRALRGLDRPADALLVDGPRANRLCALPQWTLVGGDDRALSIAAASVLAKTWRDAWMIGLSRRWPQYAFDRHKGYGTAEHRAAIRYWGSSPEHRNRWDLTGGAPLQPLQPRLPGWSVPAPAPGLERRSGTHRETEIADFLPARTLSYSVLPDGTLEPRA